MKLLLFVALFGAVSCAAEPPKVQVEPQKIRESEEQVLARRKPEFDKANASVAAEYHDRFKKCGTLRKPKPQIMQVVFANRMSNSGADVPVFFSNMGSCKDAVANGLEYYEPGGYIVKLDKFGSGFGAFSSECAITTIDICNEPQPVIQK